LIKVLHITTSSKGGAGIAALRLHNALIENGIASAYLSLNLTIDFENKTVNDDFFRYKRPSFLSKIVKKIKQKLVPSKRQTIENEFNDLCKKMKFEIATLPFSNYQIHQHPLYKEATIINLHWIDGIVDYPSFFENCDKPIVWTFHDMNPFLGIFHYKNDEIFNQKVSLTFNDKILKLKKEAIDKIKKGYVVTPSRWLLDEAKNSGVFSHFQYQEIPNCIDLNVFKCIENSSLRQLYSIEQNQFVMLFVADNINNHRKGFDLLIEAISLLDDPNMLIVTIGKDIIEPKNGLKMISLGDIHSSQKMAECFALADVFVLPSREDNLPNVMLESFACGKPVVGFSIGGIAEHTIENKTGCLATEISAIALKEALLKLKNNKQKYDSQVIRKYAEATFHPKQQADAYASIYLKLINNKAF
jgi:glycosyltransferase involved in cell wall biosynthesis